MTPTLLKTLAKLHPVIITLWGNDLIDAEIIPPGGIRKAITRELRAVMTVICEIDDEWEGRWRRRLWVRKEI